MKDVRFNYYASARLFEDMMRLIDQKSPKAKSRLYDKVKYVRTYNDDKTVRDIELQSHKQVFARVTPDNIAELYTKSAISARFQDALGIYFFYNRGQRYAACPTQDVSWRRNKSEMVGVPLATDVMTYDLVSKSFISPQRKAKLVTNADAAGLWRSKMIKFNKLFKVYCHMGGHRHHLVKSPNLPDRSACVTNFIALVEAEDCAGMVKHLVDYRPLGYSYRLHAAENAAILLEHYRNHYNSLREKIRLLIGALEEVPVE